MIVVVREEALVVGALVKLVDTVDGAHGTEVAENDLIWADADDRTVLVEQSLDSVALLHADDVGGDPEIGDGGVPGPGEGRERREEEAVEDEGGNVGEVEREEEEERSRGEGGGDCGEERGVGGGGGVAQGGLEGLVRVHD